MIGILKCPCGGVQTKRMHATVSQYARAHFKDEGNYRHVFFYKKSSLTITSALLCVDSFSEPVVTDAESNKGK